MKKFRLLLSLGTSVVATTTDTCIKLYPQRYWQRISSIMSTLNIYIEGKRASQERMRCSSKVLSQGEAISRRWSVDMFFSISADALKGSCKWRSCGFAGKFDPIKGHGRCYIRIQSKGYPIPWDQLP